MWGSIGRVGAGALLCAFAVAGAAEAATGSWDRSYGVDGRVTLNAGSVTFRAAHWQQQADGKIVIAGNLTAPNGIDTSEYLVARFNTDGSADSSFDGDGLVRFSFSSQPFGVGTIDLALQPDGKIVVVAQGGNNFDHARLLRLNVNGSRDQGFGTAGELQLRYSRFAQNPFLELGPNGTILVVSRLGDWLTSPTVVITRVTPAGAIDPAFGTAGSIELNSPDGHLDAHALTVLPDSSMAVAGALGELTDSAPFIARVTADGRRVTSFGNNGIAVLPLLEGEGYALQLVATADGKFVATGQREDSTGVMRHFVARVAANGVLDPTFGSSGRIIVLGGIESVLVEPDGRIVLSGTTSELNQGLAWLARYNVDGSPDMSFGLRGASRTDFSLGAVQSLTSLLDARRNADGSYSALVRMTARTGSFISTFAIARFLASGATAGVIGVRSSLEVSEGTVILEGNFSLPVTVFRSAGVDGVVSAQYRVLGETATAGQDFVADTGTVTFNDGEFNKSLSVQVLDDSLPENNFNERFYIELFAPTGGAGLSKSRATFEIFRDSDIGARVELVSTVTHAAESASFARFMVQRAGDLGGPLTVSYSSIPSTAVAGDDFTGGAGTVSWPANEGGVRTFDVQIVNDGNSEPSESFVVELGSAAGLTIPSGLGTATVTIIDDDDASTSPALGSSAGDIIVNEGAASAVITVNRFGDPSQAVTASWNTTFNAGNSTATAGQDYVESSGTLSWGAGDTTARSISIPLLNDATGEVIEFVAVNLFADSPAANVGGLVRVWIKDDDVVPALPVINIGAGGQILESVGTLTVPITLSAMAVGPVSVSYQVFAGTASVADVAFAAGAQVWLAGDTAPKILSIPIANDALDELDETFTIRLSSPGGAVLGTASAEFTILDDDPTPAGQPGPVAPGVRVVSQTLTVNENQQTLRLQVARVGDPDVQLFVTALSGSGTATVLADFIFFGAGLRWDPGETGIEEIEIHINGDTVSEPDETFTVRFLPRNAGTATYPESTATVTIIDDDQAVVQPALVGFMQSAQSVSESATTVTVQVARSGNSQVASSVDYVTANVTASSADYQSSSGTLTWAANDTSVKLITITLMPDTLDEPDETFTVTLRDVSSGSELDGAAVAVTITDDDLPPTGPGPAPPSSGGGGGGGGGTQSALAFVIFALLLALRRSKRYVAA
jgi:uncharacterized delta-60 repeat protein